MYKLIILLVLLVAVFGSKKIAQSDLSANIVYPVNGKAVYVSTLNNNDDYKDVVPGAKWIWDNNGLNTPKGDRVNVEINFWARCTGEMTLSFAGYGNWWVYLDGSIIKQGNTWKEAT